MSVRFFVYFLDLVFLYNITKLLSPTDKQNEFPQKIYFLALSASKDIKNLQKVHSTTLNASYIASYIAPLSFNNNFCFMSKAFKMFLTFSFFSLAFVWKKSLECIIRAFKNQQEIILCLYFITLFGQVLTCM